MKPAQLYEQLSGKYQILLFKDLAEVTRQPQAAYKLLQEVYRPAYQPLHRLIFYTGHAVPQALQDHVQEAIDLMDISSSFVEIIQDPALESLPLESNYRLSPSICPLPWTHLEIGNFGDVKACCVSQDKIGTVADGLDFLFFDQSMQELRSQMLAGQHPDNCKNCWMHEKHNQTSYRQRQLAYNKKQFLTKWIDQPGIKSLDIKPGTICNFKCRICNSDASSKHAEEQLRFARDGMADIQARAKIAQGQWFEDELTFADQLIELLPNIENFDFYGGEPFLLKQLTRIMQQAVTTGHSKHIRLHFNSNASVFPDHLVDLWGNFQEINLALSIDNVGARFELERGGSWSVIERNIDRYAALDLPNFKYYIFASVNIQNVLYLDELLDWAQRKNLEVVTNIVLQPEPLCIDFLTDAAKSLILNKFQNHPNIEIQKILKRITNSTGSNGQKFVQIMKDYDQKRNQQFVLTHKEIANAMGYSVQ